MLEIKNTISFAYPIGSAKPTIGEMANFVKGLDSNPVDIDTVYRIGEERAVFVRYKSEASMHYALMHNPEHLTFDYANGKKVEVRMSVAGGLTEYVRIYDLPPEVTDAELELVLVKYGKIKRIVREKFPADLCLDIYTGVRGVHMEVEKEIPSSLYFASRKGNIFYSGNKKKCFVCQQEGHRMSSCPKRQARKQQQPGVSNIQQGKRSEIRNTYADAVIGDPSLDGGRSGAGEEAKKQDEQIMETGDAMSSDGVQEEARRSDPSLDGGRSGAGEEAKKQNEQVMETRDALSSDGVREEENHQKQMQEDDMSGTEYEISEDETPTPSYKDNPFYKIALEFKRRQDEEKEKKRLQEKKELREREKAKARKKTHKY